MALVPLSDGHLQQDLAALGEFDGVADQVDDHLAQPDRIAAQPCRHILGDEIDELEIFGGATLAEHGRNFGKNVARIEIALEQLEAARFNLREIENVVDEGRGALDPIPIGL